MRYYAFACKQGPLDIASKTRPTAERSVRGHAINLKRFHSARSPSRAPPTAADSRTRFCDQCRRLHSMNSLTTLLYSHDTIDYFFTRNSIKINDIVIRMLNAWFNITHVTGIMFCVTYIKIYLSKF